MTKTPQRWLTCLAQHFLPNYCILCYEPLSTTKYSSLCHTCLNTLPFQSHLYCHQCANPFNAESTTSICADCLTLNHHFDTTCVAFRYQTPIDKLILDFKQRHNFSTYQQLTHYLTLSIQQSSIQQPSLHQQLPDYLIPVPLHWRNYFARGFNQAQLIAESLSLQLSVPYRLDVVKKVRFSSLQKNKNRQQRLKILNGQFLVTANVKNHCIGIVDDVITTAATVEAIARQLKRAGARRVVVYALARTPKHL